jgi:predicted lysophospholipase L1 biosynthesis ABC-type transport system permease subunit
VPAYYIYLSPVYTSIKLNLNNLEREQSMKYTRALPLALVLSSLFLFALICGAPKKKEGKSTA